MKQKGNAVIDLLAIAVAAVITVSVAAFPLYIVTKLSCASRWEDSGFESRLRIMAGCQIKVDGRWIPEDRYRTVEE